MPEAFELSREHQKHDHERQHERRVQSAARALEFARLAVVVDLRMRRQLGANQVFHIVERFTQRVARIQIRGDRNRTQPIEALELHGTGHFLDVHEIREGHERVCRSGAHVHVGEIARRRTILLARLQDDVVFLAALEERRHDARAHHRLERAAHCGQRDAEIGGAIAIHRDSELRFACVEIGIEIGQAGILRRLLEHDVAPSREFLVVAAAEHDLHRRPAAAHAEPAGRTRP